MMPTSTQAGKRTGKGFLDFEFSPVYCVLPILTTAPILPFKSLSQTFFPIQDGKVTAKTFCFTLFKKCYIK